MNSFLRFSAHTLGSLSPGEDYTFAVVAVKFGEKSAEVELDGNTSMCDWLQIQLCFCGSYFCEDHLLVLLSPIC